MELLNVLRRAGVCKTIILKVTTIRPVLEYTVPVWQSISDYLADVIESVSVKMGNYFSLWRNPIRRPWVKQTCRLCRSQEKIYAINIIMEKMKSRTSPSCYLGLLQVLVIDWLADYCNLAEVEKVKQHNSDISNSCFYWQLWVLLMSKILNPWVSQRHPLILRGWQGIQGVCKSLFLYFISL